MTFLAPSPLPDAVEATAWRAYVSRRTRAFFDDNCRDDSFDAVCFMLVPRPASLPILAVHDSYDEVDTLTSQMLHAITLYERGVNYVENTAGQIVLAWPLFFVDDDHRDIVLDLLRETARNLKATATAIVSECWMRTNLTAPSGAGSDVLITCCEQVGYNVALSVAEITGEPPARSLGAWTPLDGLVAGRLILGLFNDENAVDDADNHMPYAPPGFTPINVATVGEA